MRKLFVSILAVLYMAAASGASINIHYCMDRLVGMEWGHNSDESEACGKCGMDKSQDSGRDNCCKDEHKFVKIDQDQQAAISAMQLIKGTSTALVIPFALIPQPALVSITEAFPVTKAPPRFAPTAIFKMNCIYRI